MKIVEAFGFVSATPGTFVVVFAILRLIRPALLGLFGRRSGLIIVIRGGGLFATFTMLISVGAASLALLRPFFDLLVGARLLLLGLLGQLDRGNAAVRVIIIIRRSCRG